MGGFFGAASKSDCVIDVLSGAAYHSHLGTRRSGLAAFDEKKKKKTVLTDIQICSDRVSTL